MKRWLDRNAVGIEDERDAPAVGPLQVEPLATRGRRLRYAVPIAVGVVLLVTALAFVGKYIEAMNLSATASPPTPTPIAWIDTIAGPTSSATPAATSIPGASASQPRVLTIRAEASASDLYWTKMQPNHFTITLTNTTGSAFPLDPCPTYRMYVLNPGASEGPTRVLNCAAVGTMLDPGQSVSLDMAFTPTQSTPSGYQLIAWKLVSPSGYQAFATLKNVFIQNQSALAPVLPGA
jgi:hypothetical protein